MRTLRINLFGRLAVFVDECPLTVGPPHTKPLELFAYLLIHRRRSHSREALATLLWPEMPPAPAKRNLRKVLCTLQHLLADAVPPGDPQVLLIEHDWLALNPALDLQLDVERFEQAYALARQHAGTLLDSQTTQVLAAAVELYADELLAGCYCDWCLHERERLENMYLELLHALMVDAEHRHAYEQAIAYGCEILRHDRASERTHRDLMRLYYLSGDRSTALRQYGHCVSALINDLGVKPRTCTEQLYRQICSDELMPSAELSAEHPELQRELGAGADRSSHLQQIRAELQRTLGQVQDELQRVERLLQD